MDYEGQEVRGIVVPKNNNGKQRIIFRNTSVRCFHARVEKSLPPRFSPFLHTSSTPGERGQREKAPTFLPVSPSQPTPFEQKPLLE